MPTYLTILRKWNNPEIIINLTSEEIELKLKYEDFVLALKELLGTPMKIWTKKQLNNKVDTAIDEIILNIKKESAKVATLRRTS